MWRLEISQPSSDLIGPEWWLVDLTGKRGRLASVIGTSSLLLFTLGFLLMNICRLPKSVGELSREGGKTGSLTVNDLDGSMFSKQRADLRLNDCCQGLSPKVSLTSF